MNKELLLEQNAIGESTRWTSSQLVIRERIKNSPFDYLQFENEKGFVSMGNYMMTDKLFEDSKQAEKYLRTNMWEIVWKVATVINTINKEEVK